MDIGANLSDPMYQGIYHGNMKHTPDLEDVISRSNCKKIIITVGSIEDLDMAQKLANNHANIYYTLGLHPTNSNMELQPIFNKLLVLKDDPKLAFLGELGLDYERLQFADKEIQQSQLKAQLDFYKQFNKPLFIHNRNSTDDMLSILQNYSFTCIFHSFTGTLEEMEKILAEGYEIGFNGSSLRSEELLENVKKAPMDKIHIESDCPWCDIRPTHASYKYVQTKYDEVKKPEKWTKNLGVKSRNEPRGIQQVAEVVAAIKGMDVQDVLDQTYKNSCRVLGFVQ